MAPLIALLWLACALAGPPAQAGGPEGWRLTLAVTGGIAGVDRQLTLASTGDVTTVDRRRGTRMTGRTPDTELAAIGSLVAGLKPLDASRPAVCADCFNYAL